MPRLLAAFLVLAVALAAQATNSALLIGIGCYDQAATGWSPVHGNNDAELLSKALEGRGFAVASLADAAAAKANIVEALEQLRLRACTGDTVYIHFSGHGQLVSDLNDDECDDYDQSFVCFDACFSPRYRSQGKPYRGQNHLIDDELFPLLNALKSSLGPQGLLTVVFDTCYSGGADRGGSDDDPLPNSEVEWTQLTRGASEAFAVNASAQAYLRRIRRPGRYAAGAPLTVVSACGRDSRNYECRHRLSGRIYGSLSFCIARMLETGVPLADFGDFFASGRYKTLKVFRPSQHPVVEQYK